MAGLHSLWDIAPTMKISDKMSFVAESDQKDIIIWTDLIEKKSEFFLKTNNLNKFSSFQLEICSLSR